MRPERLLFTPEKSSLANVAAGVMLISFRPFKVGDYVEAGGTAGIVESIAIFNTVFRTGDNREVTVPHGRICGGTIYQLSGPGHPTHRSDVQYWLCGRLQKGQGAH